MLNEGYTYTDRVKPEESGGPIVDFYALRYPHSSKEEWTVRIREGTVLRNGGRVSPDTEVEDGDVLTYHRLPWQEPTAPRSFAVLFQDEHLLAVAKPSGLPVLPGGEHLENTLLHVVRQRYGSTADPLHRLGRGTSGIVLFARSQLARRALSEDIHDRRVTKIYRALASGIDMPDAFTVDTPIGRVPYPVIGALHAASVNGKPSRSICRVLHRDVDQDRTIVEVDIVTGRPHQIRIHLAAAGHPLVGDPLYAPGGGPVALPDGDRIPLPGDTGYHLHAHRIAFEHPASRECIQLECHPPSVLRLPSEQSPNSSCSVSTN